MKQLRAVVGSEALPFVQHPERYIVKSAAELEDPMNIMPPEPYSDPQLRCHKFMSAYY